MTSVNKQTANYRSLSSRVKISVVANTLRSLISFISGLIIARGLGPSNYGDLMFLMGSFVAIKAVTNMGTSNAYFTFLSRRIQPLQFNLAYFVWQIIQFLLVVLVIWFVLPDTIIEKIWLAHSRDSVLLAFLATFMQQQVWQTVTSIGDAFRKTLTVQLINIVIAFFHLTSTLILFANNTLTVENIFILLIIQYLAATSISFWLLKGGDIGSFDNNFSYKKMIGAYFKYCRPLILSTMITFLYDFFDKWMLQRYGGSSQQGYFQAANQFTTVSLLATTSILGVFWKEIAEAWANKDIDKVATLYLKFSRGLLVLSAIFTGFLVPWSKEILLIFLGPNYVNSWLVFSIMMLYPIHQSLGQIGGTMLLASGRTDKTLSLNIIFAVVSLPVTYIALAPKSGAFISGMELGAIGIVTKMVGLGIFSVNLQSLIISRFCGWKFDWKYQFFGIPVILSSGYLAYAIVNMLWRIEDLPITELFFPFAIYFLIYLVFVSAILWFYPWLIAMSRSDFKRLMAVKV